MYDCVSLSACHVPFFLEYTMNQSHADTFTCIFLYRCFLFSSLVLSTFSPCPVNAEVHAEKSRGSFSILQNTISPGEKRETSFLQENTFTGAFTNTIAYIAHGTRPGPTLCLTGAVHGDEINGFEIAYRVYDKTDAKTLGGTLVALPAVNAFGLRTGSRYLPDRRDLNRSFPGSKNGSLASRLAYVIFTEVIKKCDRLIDLHTGSAARTNLPQIRTDITSPAALTLAKNFGVGVILHGEGPEGSLRGAALQAGIPAIIYEAGEPLRFEETEIQRGLQGVLNVMSSLKMIPARKEDWTSVVYKETSWLRARTVGGIFRTSRKSGEMVKQGDVLGSVVDPITLDKEEIVSPTDGQIIGMAVPQVVLVGFALFHIGKNPVEMH